MLGTAIEQIALGVRHWQRTEVGEAEEGFGVGPEGLVGDAAQEEPDPVGEPEPGSRGCCAATPRPAWRTSRCGTSATSRTRASSASRCPTRRSSPTSCSRARRRSCRASSSIPRGCARTSSGSAASTSREAVLLALVKTGLAAPEGVRDGPALGARRDRGGRAEGLAGAKPGRFRELLGKDADVASRLTAAAARRVLRPRASPAVRARDPRARVGEVVHDSRDQRRHVSRAVGQTLDGTPWTALGGRALPRYDGKVRDCYIDQERGERVIVVTDRLSAFDAVSARSRSRVRSSTSSRRSGSS